MMYTIEENDNWLFRYVVKQGGWPVDLCVTFEGAKACIDRRIAKDKADRAYRPPPPKPVLYQKSEFD